MSWNNKEDIKKNMHGTTIKIRDCVYERNVRVNSPCAQVIKL